MSLNLLIGKKNKDGTIDSITVRQDGGLDQNKLLYKYYRTPERVGALISNGGNRGPLGIYISNEEFNPDSPLYNEEVTMLPLSVGFPDDFYNNMNSYYNTHQTYKEPSEEAFFADAERVGFDEDFVYLYDIETQAWTVGKNKIGLRNHIIEQCKMDNDSDLVSELISHLNSIDSFIERRKKARPVFIADDGVSQQIIYSSPRLLAKYNEFARLAETYGIQISGCMCKLIDKENTKEEASDGLRTIKK